MGSFDEILAEARQQAGGAAAGAADLEAEAAAEGEQPGGAAAAAGEGDPAATAAGSPSAAGAAEAAASGDGDAAETGEGGEGDDLLIMDSDEEGSAEVRLVELPSTVKKKPHMPFFTQVCVGGRAGESRRGRQCRALKSGGWWGAHNTRAWLLNPT